MFAGTDVGVYLKDGSNDWAPFSDGLPNVVVTELEFYYGATQAEDRLRAGTFGRGLWETTLPSALPVEIKNFTASPVNGNRVQLHWMTATEVNNYGFEVQRSTDNATWKAVHLFKGAGTTNSPKFYSYEDMPYGGSTFFYRLKQIDADGRYELTQSVEVEIGTPSRFMVHQNYPNPFNPTTTIMYEIPDAGNVSITLYDFIGREIATLSNKYETAGYHQIGFDGSQLASGIYCYTVRAGNLLQSKKMVLMK